ncbi:Glycosyltransferase [Heracleum sosnowskyi]|uniref:Glycosyltransferase n=1 Tax=Heracleum sosnowskyi TaxID=360622 RepID=A0AAD8MLV9_9APIA|nr:Glycosyltransferase [Heracleum sosnowskyi]
MTQVFMNAENKKVTVLLFPWLAHGHISPFVELGKKLRERNFDVHLCSTPANLTSIKKRMGEESSIQLVQLNLPNLPNLPPYYHTTNGLPPHLMDTLKCAYDMAKPEFSKILQTVKPDLLIYDFLRPWPAEAASELCIPAVQFIATSATMTSFMLHTFKCPGKEYPFSTIFYRDYENAQVRGLGECPELRKAIESLELSNKVILIKGIKEMEGNFSDYLSTLSGKKIVHVGPLVQDPISKDENPDIIKWLNKKKQGSTIFVSFGSEYFLSKEDFEEMAHGLMLSNVNFIWVVRFPVGEKIRIEDKLPLGFRKKVGDRGMIVEGWAPQAKILGHSSIGGFVSHCGWSSVIESMHFGVPIIAMPMHLDQPLNARLVKEFGTGIEVLRDEYGRFKREKIASVIRQVVAKRSGRCVRKKAKELGDSIRKKGDEEMDEVVKELMQLNLFKNREEEIVQSSTEMM